jgi:hypothetical protein
MRPDRSRAAREVTPRRDRRTDVEEPGDPDAIPPATVWRAGHEPVATGPLRAHGTDVYNAEDEPLQEVTDHAPRSTRGRPAKDDIGISTAEKGDAKTGRTPDGR